MSAIAISAALACSTWGLYALLRGSLLAGCVVFLLAAACLGREFLKLQMGPLPLSMDRLWIAGLVAAWITQRSLQRTWRAPLRTGDYLLLGLILWLTASTFAHDYLRTFRDAGGAPLWRLVSGYWMPAAIYFVARESRLTETTWKAVLTILCLFGVYLSLTGLCEIAGLWPAVFPTYIRDPGVGIHFGRARGPFVSAVSYGLYMSVFLACLWALYFHSRPAWKPFLVLAAPLFLAAVFFSYTRTAWIGTALAGLVVLALTLRGRLRMFVLGAAVAGGLIVLAGKSDSLVSVQRDISANESKHSTMMRASFGYISWKMFLARPVDGFGFGQFPNAKLEFLYDRDTALVLEDTRPYVHHSTLLSLLTETGAVGLLLFLATLTAWSWQSRSILRMSHSPSWYRTHAVLFLAALAAYSSQLMFHELTYKPVDNALIFFLAGLNSSLAGRITHPSRNHRHWFPAMNVSHAHPLST